VDTVRGALNTLISNSTDGSTPSFNTVTAFTSIGFSVGTSAITNSVGTTYVSWTFREAPNFFDVVTYTGDGTVGRNISHNLGVAPGMMIVKCTNTSTNWAVYHRSTGNAQAMNLNSTNASASAAYWASTSPTATQFTLGAQTDVNGAGNTYVAYLFAHVTASDGIIQCGSYTGNGSSTGPVVTLGWEPQWLLIKNATGSTDWLIVDNMRGLPVGSAANVLYPNNAFSEATWPLIDVAATGFQIKTSDGAINNPGSTYIYMAIRRGPMRTPTLGTSVFTTILQSPQSPNTLRTIDFPADLIIGTVRGGGINRLENTKLTGFANTSGGSINTPGMFTNTTGAESNQYPLFYNVWNTTARDGDYLYLSNNVNWFFRRAPGFMDEVCWTCASSPQTIPHNLGVVPELIITKQRNGSSSWFTASQFGGANYLRGALQTTGAFTTQSYGTGEINSIPTASNFAAVNFSTSNTYVSYLFASAPGVSKVGSYTGNGSSQTINCAFTTGARFVMIKRTDSTGDWYVWDSARGIVAGNDPYLALNDTQAEVTSNDSVDTDNTGFVVNQVSASNVNVNAATYIFLAIA
jgi:hypothetical protein